MNWILCIAFTTLLQVLYLCRSEAASETPTIELIDQQLLNDELIKPQNMQPMTAYIMGDLPNNASAAELTRLALQSKLYYAIYNDLFMQRYASLTELEQSGGPHTNNEQCLRHLQHLVGRVELLKRDGYNSQDTNLAQLLDSYGRRPSGVYLGSGYWPGSYQECLRTSIDTPDGQVPSRYCVAHIRPTGFTMNKDSLIDKLTFFKSGVCLPRSCDSMNYKNKLELIEKLMDYNSRTPVEPLEGNLTHLYCLPDSESPLRAWWLQPKTVTVVVWTFGWLGLLVFATARASRSTEQDVYKSLSITHNFRRLFATGSRSNKDGTLGQQPVVDLSVIDGIKVLAMMYITIAHVLMCMMHIIDDGTEARSSFLFALANMAPTYSVNAFFGITALLTSYMMFKHNQTQAFVKNPVRWVAMLLQRYLRIMPMYIIVVVYAKYLSRYTGSGPFWDYGTSELSHRRTCEQESWLWTLLFGSNFKNPLSHCLETGWYLALDFQFLAVTPLFLIALQLRPQLGKALLILVIISSYFASILDYINMKIDDFRTVQFHMPHGFKTYVTNINDGYSFPQFRIPVYLCGLLAGYYLFQHERNKVESNIDKRKQPVVLEDNICRTPDWHPLFKRYTQPICILYIISVGSSPFWARYLKNDKASARVIAAALIPLTHICYSLVVSLFTLMAATGNGIHHLNSFLSAKVWKPLARLSLCAMLINVEVVHYITEVRTQLMNLDFISHLSLYLIAIIAVYTISALLYVLFELPIKAMIDSIMLPKSRTRTKS